MTEAQLDIDAVLDLCRKKHRRIVLAALAEQKRSPTLDDLVKAIVEHNHHVPLTEASDESVARIKTSLYHCHIPKLADAGIVEFDADRGLVEPTETFERIESPLVSILEVDSELSTPIELDDAAI